MENISCSGSTGRWNARLKLSFNNEMERNETRKLYQEARAKMVQSAAEAG